MTVRNLQHLHQSKNWQLSRKRMGKGINRHVTYVNNGFNDQLEGLMNAKIKEKLRIPLSVTWGGQSGEVFEKWAGDFMNPVVSDVEILLDSTNVNIVVYTGQLDLVVDTLGTEAWIYQLRWDKITDFRKGKKELKSRSV